MKKIKYQLKPYKNMDMNWSLEMVLQSSNNFSIILVKVPFKSTAEIGQDGKKQTIFNI